MNNATHHHRRSNESGLISVFVVLGIGIFALGTSFTIAGGTIAGSRKNQNAESGGQVFYAAESGMMEATYQFLNSGEMFTSDSYPGINDSAADISAEMPTWPYVILSGQANNALSERAVHTRATVFAEGMAFDYATFAMADLVFKGNAQVNGNIFANGDISFSGNSAEVNGDAYSPTEIGDEDNINGDRVSGVDPLPAPQIGEEPYRSEAEAAGTLFADSEDAEDYLNNQQRNAVMFVTDAGTTKVQGTNTNLTGTLFVLGNLEITGGTYTATADHAAIVVRGNLKIAGGATINGIVHVSGATSFGAGSNVINGSLISVGGASETELTGSATINYDPDLATLWPNLLGLETTSTEAPRLLQWGEE